MNKVPVCSEHEVEMVYDFDSWRCPVGNCTLPYRTRS